MRNRALLAFALTVPVPAIAAQSAPYPPNKLIAEIPLDVFNVVPTLNGRRLYYIDYTPELWVYDVASKRSTKVAAGEMDDASVSAQGNRIAFKRSGEGGTRENQEIWTIPLDPRTGLATGPARRASVGLGTDPSVSPDGKWIAFASRVGGYHLAVIPAEGGAERVLLNGIGSMDAISWSPDQQWLYFNVAFPGSPERTVQRIAVAGGKPEVIARGHSDWWAGLSPDGKVIAPWTRSSRLNQSLTLMDASGKQQLGQIRIPAPEAWLSPTEMMLWEGHRLHPLKSVSLADGKVRELLPASYDVRTPAWAPDGKTFAVLGWNPFKDKESKLLIANADGSNLRVIPVTDQFKETILAWSPDSRWIAMTKSFGIGIDVVEVASGRSRRLRTAVSSDIYGLRWTADSKHVRYHYAPPDSSRPGGNASIFREVGLDGSDVLVRDMGGQPMGGAIISDTTVVVWDSSGTYLQSMTSDRSVRLWPGPGGANASPRGDLVAMTPPGYVLSDTNTKPSRTVEIKTSAGTLVTSVVFPRRPVLGRTGFLHFMPDGRHLLAWGWNVAAKGCCMLFLAPIDGGPVRTIAAFDGKGIPPMALSPDGKTLLYAGEGTTFRTRVWAVDVSGHVSKLPKD
jgi:Tol biopolymer transport system component